MKTRDRILETSLLLFNELGEPNTTTNSIADEMNISPGNLYYHYRSKEQIVTRLFDRYERRALELLAAVPQQRLGMDDLWLVLHLAFELIWEYRFIYRDLDNLLRRYRGLRRRFGRLVARFIEVATSACQALVKAGVMRASPEEVQVVGRNVVLVTTYWLNFENIAASPEYKSSSEQDRFARGCYQVLSLLAPFLEPRSRALLNDLARRYLR
jgi:AcrR family transcriptional regulator